MRKSLFAIGLLAISYSVQAQNILCHVDTDANMYVSKGTLVYSGGGMQMKGTGKVENHGNFMVAGTGSDSFKTINALDNLDKTEATGGGNFVNMLNESDNYALVNSTDPLVAPVYTYGQLFISGIPQNNITGIVDQQFRQIKHGSYQQVGMPFYDKTVSTLNAELGKTFNNVRGSQNDILVYGNANVVSYGIDQNLKFGNIGPAYSYYMLGGQGLDLASALKTVKGRPFSDASQTETLTGAGSSINFGSGGNNKNQYNEKYNSYVQDRWETSTGGTAWVGDFGKNIYQFSNPFLTNLDLSGIAYDESAVSDGVNLTKVIGARVEVTGVVTNSQTGTGTASYTTSKFLTFAAGKPTGDVEYQMIRPMGAFVLKLDDNTATDQLNFANLRRFNYHPRAQNTNYSVTASKNTSTGTVKQLGVIGLDANGYEVGRTYYVVYPNGTTGHSASAKTQMVATSSNVFGTFEEAQTGGYDPNYTSAYWLYINEANESNFKGKNIKLVNYDLTKVKSYKFEVREDTKLIPTGTHQLSTGVGFFYKAQNGTVMQIKGGDIIPVATSEYDLYYGEPDKVLAAETPSVKVSRTLVVYNPEITQYVVRFDPNWKKADIEVYDMSGKLVISKKAVSTSTDFVIELDKSIKNSYVVKVVSDKGETVNTKILK